MSHPFDRTYFTDASVYAKFRDTVHAIESVSRWHGATFRAIARAAGGLKRLAGANVAEVGCGYAGLLRLFSAAGARCVGIDIAEYVIEQDRKILPQMDFRIGSVTALEDVLPERMDVVVCIEVLEHLPDAFEGLDALLDRVKAGGLLAFSTPNLECRLPGYDWRADPTHISVHAMSRWRRELAARPLEVISAGTVAWVPSVWRLGRTFSRHVHLGDWGPTSFCIVCKR